jgi:hypothetical protein
MSRKYADPIHVRSAGVSHGSKQDVRGCDVSGRDVREQDVFGRGLVAVAQSGVRQHGSGPPEQFLWRGRLYVVRAVLSHWLESASWWGGSRRALEGAIPPHEQEVWRVEAQPGRSSQPGIYDLCRDSVTDQWVLTRSLD